MFHLEIQFIVTVGSWEDTDTPCILSWADGLQLAGCRQESLNHPILGIKWSFPQVFFAFGWMLHSKKARKKALVLRLHTQSDKVSSKFSLLHIHALTGFTAIDNCCHAHPCLNCVGWCAKWHTCLIARHGCQMTRAPYRSRAIVTLRHGCRMNEKWKPSLHASCSSGSFKASWKRSFACPLSHSIHKNRLELRE